MSIAWDSILTVALGVFGIVVALGAAIGLIWLVVQIGEAIRDTIDDRSFYEKRNDELKEQCENLTEDIERRDDQILELIIKIRRLKTRLKDATGVEYTGDEPLTQEEEDLHE